MHLINRVDLAQKCHRGEPNPFSESAEETVAYHNRGRTSLGCLLLSAWVDGCLRKLTRLLTEEL